jgi:hypothetical protein
MKQLSERVYGSERFRALTRNPSLPSPVRFEPTPKGCDDIIIGANAELRSSPSHSPLRAEP